MIEQRVRTDSIECNLEHDHEHVIERGHAVGPAGVNRTGRWLQKHHYPIAEFVRHASSRQAVTERMTVPALDSLEVWSICTLLAGYERLQLLECLDIQAPVPAGEGVAHSDLLARPRLIRLTGSGSSGIVGQYLAR